MPNRSDQVTLVRLMSESYDALPEMPPVEVRKALRQANGFAREVCASGLGVSEKTFYRAEVGHRAGVVLLNDAAESYLRLLGFFADRLRRMDPTAFDRVMNQNEQETEVA